MRDNKVVDGAERRKGVGESKIPSLPSRPSDLDGLERQ
jgi:hypothetical protein